MRCDFCDEPATLIAGYSYCQSHARGLDRIAIHNMILGAFPSITMTRIHDLCQEMFGEKDYGFASFPRLYSTLDRGEIVTFGPRRGFYLKSQEQYLIEVFDKFLQEKHPRFYQRVKEEKVERYY